MKRMTTLFLSFSPWVLPITGYAQFIPTVRGTVHPYFSRLHRRCRRRQHCPLTPLRAVLFLWWTISLPMIFVNKIARTPVSDEAGVRAFSMIDSVLHSSLGYTVHAKRQEGQCKHHGAGCQKSYCAFALLGLAVSELHQVLFLPVQSWD